MSKRNFLIISTLLTLFVFCIPNILAKPVPKLIMRHDYSILKPYIMPYIDLVYNKEYLKNIQLNDNFLHPLTTGFATFHYLKKTHDINDKRNMQLAKGYLDLLLSKKFLIEEKENSILWKYNFKFNELEPGWWSSMANSIIALSFLCAWQEFGLVRYKDIADKAINGVILPIEKGGSTLWLDENSCWFSEYSHENLRKDNEYYVLNGFLFSLLTVRLYANVTGDEELRKIYHCGLNGLKKIVPKFYNKEMKWTYYMLNPLTPESTHYFIFEMSLYESLYNLTDDDFYLQQLRIYRNIFRENYPLEIYEEENNEHFLFSLIGPPNPYWIDTYSIRINFLNEKGEIIEIKQAKHQRDKNKHIKEKAFIYGKVTKNFRKYKIYSCYGKREQFLYEGLIKQRNRHLSNPEFRNDCRMPESIKYNLLCAFDAEREDNQSVKISPSKITVPEIKDHDKNDRGVLAFFVSLLDLTKYKFFGFVINPLEDLRSIRFCLHDANENSTCRYYADIRNNIDNFILLTLSGFNNQNFEPNLIKKINLIIPTSDKFHVKEFKIKIKKFLVFKNNIELFNFVMSNDFFFPEQPYD